MKHKDVFLQQIPHGVKCYDIDGEMSMCCFRDVCDLTQEVTCRYLNTTDKKLNSMANHCFLIWSSSRPDCVGLSIKDIGDPIDVGNLSGWAKECGIK